MSTPETAPRASALKEALLIIEILKRIPRNRWISTQELESSLAEAGLVIARRRLQRLLKEISASPDLHVECDMRAKPYGYRQRIPASELGCINLRPTESLLLRLAEEHLRNQLPAPVTGALEPLFNAARRVLREGGSMEKMSAWLKKVAFVSGTVPMLPPKILPRIFSAVSEALYRDSKLEIEYVNSKDDRTKGVVSPLGLVQQEERLYLVCRFEGYENVRHLALHRLLSARVLDFPADRPQDFRLDDYVRERHFNFSNGRRIRLTLEFTSGETAKILEETPFEPRQKLERLPSGLWHLEADMDDTVLLDGWISAWRKRAGIIKIEKRTLPPAR